MYDPYFMTELQIPRSSFKKQQCPASKLLTLVCSVFSIIICEYNWVDLVNVEEASKYVDPINRHSPRGMYTLSRWRFGVPI